MGGVLVPLLRALLLWAVFILAESVQGALRRWWLGPQMEIAMRLVPVAAGVAWRLYTSDAADDRTWGSISVVAGAG